MPKPYSPAICEAHNQVPDPTAIEGLCYGGLYRCSVCTRTVCFAFGGVSGDEANNEVCDDCYVSDASAFKVLDTPTEKTKDACATGRRP